MGISSGFFDSLNGDRKYNVTQLSVLVSSLIKDGVFQNIGTAFSVVPNVGSEVLIGLGYGFFKHRWIQNDSLYPLNMGAAELLLDRIDAVVIEIDNTEAVRLGTIKKVKGAPSATPVRPALIKTDFINQYPLAYILRPANNDNIVVGNITQMIGTAECPFVIGVQETLDIDFLFAQWGGQWSTWFTALQNESETDINTLIANSNNSMDGLFDDFDAWFQNMKNQLTTDAAGNLQNQINTINTNAGGWKTYSSLSAVNASLTNASKLKDIIPLMSDKSIIRLDNTQINLTDTAKGNEIAFVEIVRYTPARTIIKGYRTGSSVTDVLAAEYFALWDFDDVVVRGFYKLMDSNDPGCVYTSVTEIGLNAATCTLADIWNAMQNNSEIILDSAVLPAVTIPTAPSHGTIHIIKAFIARQAKIEFLPKMTYAPYYMNLNVSNIPDGTWKQYASKSDLGVQVAVQSTAPADTTKLWVW